jgi:hypothetical protein
VSVSEQPFSLLVDVRHFVQGFAPRQPPIVLEAASRRGWHDQTTLWTLLLLSPCTEDRILARTSPSPRTRRESKDAYRRRERTEVSLKCQQMQDEGTDEQDQLRGLSFAGLSADTGGKRGTGRTSSQTTEGLLPIFQYLVIMERRV